MRLSRTFSSLSQLVNPFASTATIDDSRQPLAFSGWPRIVDYFCWLYPLCIAIIAFGTTIFLRAGSIDISAMQYDFYFEETNYWQQFWYDTTLLLLVFSPLVILLSPLIQFAWPGGLLHQRARLVAGTILVWLSVSLFFSIANVPILDFLFD